MNIIMVFIFSAFTAIAALPLPKSLLLSNKIPLHTGKGNFAQIISFLESVPDTEAKCLPAEVLRTQAGMLVPEYIDKKRYNDAENTLNGLAKDNLEREKKDEFYRVHIELGKTDRKPTDMTVTEKNTVEQVAMSETEVSYNAKAMLHFWFNEKYDPVLEPMSSNRIAQQDVEEKEIPIFILDESTMISGIYPNPNNGSMQIDYHLSEGQRGEIIIYDMIGKKVKSFILKNENNSLQINEAGLKDGLYLYTVSMNNEIVISEKLLIIK